MVTINAAAHGRLSHVFPWRLAPILVVLLVSGCATLSESQCVSGDWYAIGQRDGARGLERSRLFQHGQACAKYGTQPDARAYDAGRSHGLVRYCTPRQGFVEGREGRAYHGVCAGRAEGAFLAEFRAGERIHDAEEELERIERQLHSTESALGKEGLDKKERKRLHDRLGELRNDQRRARRQLDYVMSRYRGGYWYD